MSDLSPQVVTGKVRVPIGCEQLPGRVRLIVEDIARDAGLCPGALTGRARDQRTALARREAMARLRSMPWGKGKPTVTMIAKWFNRDHSTVVYALKRAAR